MSDFKNLSVTELSDIAKSYLTGSNDPSSNDLVEILSLASDLYHNEGESFVTDEEYDSLEIILKNIDTNNPFLSNIGSEVRGGKIPLPEKLGGLDQIYTGDIEKWINSNNWKNESFILSNKEDGVSCYIVYGRGGSMNIGYSRGNGIEGADWTRHLKNIPDIPKKMSVSAAVRIEIVMEDGIFAKQQHLLLKSDGTPYKNARGYVAGRMNASESPEWFYKNVRAIATSVVHPKMSKQAQFEFLTNNGWHVPVHVSVKGKDLSDEFLINYLNERRTLSNTAIDGIVIDLDNDEIRNSLVRVSSSINPMFAKKYKVGTEDNIAQTKTVKVHWEASKDGYCKPRVQIEPVELMGVTVTYCTGFNAKFIRDNKIGPGAILQVTRSGDVIPFIQSVISPANEAQLPSEEKFGKLEWTKGEVDLKLIDASNNREVQINILIEVFSKLEVPHLRQGSIEKLVDAGYTNAVSIIKAPKNILQRIIGESAGEKIYEGIKQKLNPVELYILAGASQKLGRGIGRRRMKKLLEAIGNDMLLEDKISYDSIVAVEGFEKTTAELLLSNVGKFQIFLADIEGYYSISKPKPVNTDGKLAGNKICFTGVRDKDLQAKIEAESGIIVDSINAETTHLVCKDKTSTSGKMAKAAKFAKEGTLQIIELTEAQQMWG